MLVPEGFPLLPLDFGPAGEVEEPLVARSVDGSSLLSPRFIRGLGIQELFSCDGLLLPVLSRLVLPPHLCALGVVLGGGGGKNLRGLSLFSVASPASSLHARRGGGAGESSAPVRVLPGLPILGLGSREGV